MELWTHVKSTEKIKPRRHCLSESDGSTLLESKCQQLWRTSSLTESIIDRTNQPSRVQSIIRLISRSEYHDNLKFALRQRLNLNLLVLLLVLAYGQIFPSAFYLAIIIFYHKDIDLWFKVSSNITCIKYNLTSTLCENVTSTPCINALASSCDNITLAPCPIVTLMHCHNMMDVWSVLLILWIGGAMCGTILLSFSLDSLGRKKVSLLNSLLCVFCAMPLFLCAFIQLHIVFVLSIFLCGINSGVGRGVGVVYMLEVVSYNLRGLVGCIQQIATVLPFFLISIIKFHPITDNDWHYLLLVPLMSALSILCILPWLPDSPRHVFQTSHNYQYSLTGLKFLRKKEDVFVDIEEMETEMTSIVNIKTKKFNQQMISQKVKPVMTSLQIIETQKTKLSSVEEEDAGETMERKSFDGLRKGGRGWLTFIEVALSVHMRRRILIAIMLKAILHFSAPYFLLYEIGEVLDEYGIISPQDLPIFISFTYFLASLFAMLLLRVKRRGIVLYSLALQLLCFGFLVASFTIIEKHRWFVNLCLTGFFLHLTIFALSIGWLSSVMNLELFRQQSRSQALVISSISSYLFSLFLTTTAHYLQKRVGPFILLLNLSCCLILLLLSFAYIPETNMKTFEEICELFSPAPPIEVHHVTK